MATTKVEKREFWDKLWKLVEEYPTILLCEADNVGSKQLQEIRTKIRGKAVMLFGKNTLIRAGLKYRIEAPTASQEDYEDRKKSWYAIDQLKELLPLIKGNVGLVFCKSDTDKVLEVIEQSKVPAEAKAGTVSPVDVFVPPGPTGMDPSQTSFFQALGISTKIQKGQIEIVAQIQVIEKDKKVGNSEAVLLKKLNIKPFHFGLKVSKVYDNGSVYNADVLKLTPESILTKFVDGVKNIAAISLEIGIPTVLSAPHSIASGFKNLVALAYSADYSFAEGAGLLDLLKDPSKLAALVATPVTTSAPVAETKVEEKKEEAPQDEEAGIDMGGMFGDDDY
jgi:large subunit ribosomal protein LP0